MPKFTPAVRGQSAFSFAGMKRRVMKDTAKHRPNLRMKGMPEHVKRAVARRFQEVSLCWCMVCSLVVTGQVRRRLRSLRIKLRWDSTTWREERARIW